MDGNIRYEKMGWASEGATLEQAVAVRATRAAEQKELKLKKKGRRLRTPRQVKRLKAKHTGVYFRESFRRVCSDGKPDRCYKIVRYLGNGKYQREKIGGRSEGYEDRDAVRIGAERIRALRHPEFFRELGVTSLKFMDIAHRV